MKPFRHVEIGRLAHELALSPRRYRLRQAAGVLRAIELIDPQREYPSSFVCFQITGYRPRRTEETLLEGKPLVADLVDLLDELTRGSPLPREAAGDGLYDVGSLARRFRVSTKTVTRWRSRGLAGCWYSLDSGKPGLAFSRRAVEQFVSRHRDMVRRGAAFAVMGAEEKERIVARARELVASGPCSLHAVAVRLAEETGRAVETIRYTLRRFDRDHADQALFDRAEQGRPLDEAAVLYEAFRGGDGVGVIASRFNKREAEVRRLLTQARARELCARPIVYVYNPAFDSPEARPPTLPREIPLLAKRAETGRDELLAHEPSSLPAYLRELYRTPLLSRAEEAERFSQMNFLLHRAELLRRRLDPATATAVELAAIDALRDQATEVKNSLIQANLRLVVGIAKRHLFGRPWANLFELISDGNLALMRAVEGFDFSRGCRFSTYASWVVARHFARSVPQALSQADRFRTGREEVLEVAPDRSASAAADADASAVRAAIARSLGVLDARERTIVRSHFGLNEGAVAESLEEIGRRLRLSKERVRQLEQRAFAKLREALGDRAAELLAG